MTQQFCTVVTSVVCLSAVLAGCEKRLSLEHCKSLVVLVDVSFTLLEVELLPVRSCTRITVNIQRKQNTLVVCTLGLSAGV